MYIGKRFAGVAAVVAIAGAGLVAAPTTASAAPGTAQASCYATDKTGALGHKGKAIYCKNMTQYFYGQILCRKIDDHSNYQYWHYGPVVSPNGTSTVWCDYGAVVDFWQATIA
ncbi:hypothetical protein [Streptomyces sp. NPDC059761]|uniref:hypothetical protein n=1 Tax=Streptomyces sp. NPDC059761 TaxID=3346937 RepID=UPI00366947C7